MPRYVGAEPKTFLLQSNHPLVRERDGRWVRTSGGLAATSKRRLAPENRPRTTLRKDIALPPRPIRIDSTHRGQRGSTKMEGFAEHFHSFIAWASNSQKIASERKKKKKFTAFRCTKDLRRKTRRRDSHSGFQAKVQRNCDSRVRSAPRNCGGHRSPQTNDRFDRFVFAIDGMERREKSMTKTGFVQSAFPELVASTRTEGFITRLNKDRPDLPIGHSQPPPGITQDAFPMSDECHQPDFQMLQDRGFAAPFRNHERVANAVGVVADPFGKSALRIFALACADCALAPQPTVLAPRVSCRPNKRALTCPVGANKTSPRISVIGWEGYSYSENANNEKHQWTPSALLEGTDEATHFTKKGK
ncbi:hypothetical protein DFJ73DRAFT_945641 [Zopfochytrium polystomum]|nr:hypothetical protein DFJ73DRAFT_945641 [Zopfochytrium polystomum]